MRSRLLAAAVLLATMLAGMVALASDARAHTEFESSSPEAGQVLNDPVGEIVVTFTAAAEVAGDGFAVLLPDGEILRPPVEVGPDGRVFTMRFEPPLTGGAIGVRWAVRAGDAHPIEGSFSFTTTATPTPSATAAADAPPVATATVDVDAAAPDESDGPGQTLASPLAPDPTATSTAAVDPIPGDGAPDGSAIAAPDAAELDDFLDTAGGATNAGRQVGRVARMLAVPAALAVVGAIAFGAAIEPVPTSSTRRVITLGAPVLLLGSVLQLVGIGLVFDSAGDALTSSSGVATAVRLVAAAAIVGLSRRAGQPPQRVLLLVAGAIAVSRAFDGHTLTEGEHLLTGTVAVGHTAAAAIWIGGVLCLATAAIATPNGPAALSLARFSVLAAAALATAGIAGIALAITIVDAPSDLWTTNWGRTLIVKTTFVAAAAAIGAVNHFRLVPAVTAAPDSAPVRRRLRRTLVAESGLLLAVAITTGILVGASTS